MNRIELFPMKLSALEQVMARKGWEEITMVGYTHGNHVYIEIRAKGFFVRENEHVREVNPTLAEVNFEQILQSSYEVEYKNTIIPSPSTIEALTDWFLTGGPEDYYVLLNRYGRIKESELPEHHPNITN